MKKQIIISVIAIVLGVSCKSKEIADEPSVPLSQDDSSLICVTEGQFSSSEYKLGKLEKKLFSKQIEVNGKIHVPEKNRAKIISYIEGKVSRFDLLEGQRVSKGQYLFSLTGPQVIDLQNDYLSAKSRLEYLIYEYDRQLKLSAENITTRKELTRIKGEKQIAEAGSAALAQKLDLLGINASKVTASNLKSSIEIYAPISAVIAAINVTAGSYLGEGTVALELIDPKHLHLEMNVLEKDGFALKVGQGVKFSTVNQPEKEFEAKIYLVNKNVNAHRLISVHCHFEDSLHDQFYPDMYATGQILVGKHEAWSISEKAIVKSDGNPYLLIKDGKESTDQVCFRESVIKVGEMDGIDVEIIDPPQELIDAEVLIEGAYYITE